MISNDQMKKVMVFGTFDILHQGHLSFLRQAKKYGDYLIVVIARDRTVRDIKGKTPVSNEKQRLSKVAATGIANQVILGHLSDYYLVIKKEKPAVICLGYDQKYFTDKLKIFFPQLKIITLKPYKPEIFKSSKIKTTNYPDMSG